ncbi:hypothetical protein K2X05_02555, partial [bacterium]|nr:hypothetical protein [bacterium]
DGIMSGNYEFGTCVADAPRACTFQGSTYPNGASVTAYKDPIAVNGVCSSETRQCVNGVMSGTYAFASCELPQQQKSCVFNQTLIPHGGAVTAFLSSTPADATLCMSEKRTCNDGMLSGTYTNPQCGTNIVFNFSPVFNVNGSILGGLPLFPYKVEQINTTSLIEVLDLKVNDVVQYENLNTEPFINGTTKSLRLFNFNISLHSPIGLSKQTLVMNLSTVGKTAASQLTIDVEQDPLNTKCLNLKMFAGSLGGSIIFQVSGNYKLCEP